MFRRILRANTAEWEQVNLMQIRTFSGEDLRCRYLMRRPLGWLVTVCRSYDARSIKVALSEHRIYLWI